MTKRGNEVALSRGNVARIPSPLVRFADVDSLFDDFFSPRFPRLFGSLNGGNDFMPSVEVIDRDDQVVVRAEVPGFKKDEIEVSLSGDMLTLSGKTSTEEKEEKDNFYYSEIKRGAFTRTLQLPAEVNDSKASASMKDGVLELILPKLESSKRRTITVS